MSGEHCGVDRHLPLRGLRVVNFGWVWAGPVVGQTLGFLGAEVLKVESAARIDMTRNLPPFAEGRPGHDRSLSNHACWAGNGSVTLNLKKPEALELALRLIARADVVVENFGPGAMQRMGLGYETLRAQRADIILCSMPAAGLSGPLEHVRTYGLSLTSLTGLDSMVGYKGGDPIPMENAFSDPFVGIFGAFAILAALNHRRNTSEGQHIDFSQQEAVMQMVGPAYMDYVMNGRSSGPKSNEHPLGAAAPHSVFPCRGEDRWISIAVATEKGLVTPVLRNVERMGFADIEGAIAGYAKAAREGGLKLEDLQGGTFTITNGGTFGSLMSTPIVNPPQSAILGMHAIKERPIAENGQVVIAPMMYIALSYDHRIIDGKDAVLFLVDIKNQLENPHRMLLGM